MVLIEVFKANRDVWLDQPTQTQQWSIYNDVHREEQQVLTFVKMASGHILHLHLVYVSVHPQN